MIRTATTLPYIELEVADGNFDTSRSPIDRIIIHTMDGTWQGAAARFDNPKEQVSAHYGIKLDGSIIHWLEETYTAYHSGNYAMNQRSIGIEHEDGGDYNGIRPDALYTTSANLVRDICQFYSIPIDRQHILKHSEIIATGCPDALDIDRIVREAANSPQNQQQIIDDLRKARDDNWQLYQGEVQKNNELTSENTGLKTQLSQVNQADANLLEQYKKKLEEDATAIDTGIKAEAELKQAQTTIVNIATALHTTPDEKSILGAIQTLQKPLDDVIHHTQTVMDAMYQNLQKGKKISFIEYIQLGVNLFIRR